MGSIALAAGLQLASMPLAIVGFALAGVGAGAFYGNFTRFFSTVGIQLSMRAIPASLVLALIVYLIVQFLEIVAALAAFIILPLLAGVALSFMVKIPRKQLMDGEDVLRSEKKYQGNVNFTKWRISIYTTVFWFVFGVVWTLATAFFMNSRDSLPVFSLSFAALAAIVTVVLIALTYTYRVKSAYVFWVFVPLVILGVSVIAVLDSNLQIFAFSLVFAARFIAEVEILSHFAAISRKSGYPAELLMGRGFMMLCVGELLGIVLGYILLPLQTNLLTYVLLAIVNVIVVVLILAILQVNSRLHKNEIQALKEAQQGQLFEVDMVALLSSEYKLSARESEVLELLLAGRTIPYIAEKLFISQSTVQTHVKHIYDKTDVHSRQELIDLAHENGE